MPKETDEVVDTGGHLDAGAEPAAHEPVDDGLGEQGSEPSEDTSPAELQADLDKERKRYDDLRAYNDRRFSEMEKRFAEQQETTGGLKELLAQTQASAQVVAPAFDQKKFEEEWDEKLRDAITTGDPRALIEFQRGVARETIAYADQLRAEDKKAYHAEIGRLRSELADPLVRDHGAEITAIGEKYGVSGDVARTIYADQQEALSKANGGPSKQPVVKRPGTVVDDDGGGGGGAGPALDLSDPDVQINLKLLQEMGKTPAEAVKALSS